MIFRTAHNGAVTNVLRRASAREAPCLAASQAAHVLCARALNSSAAHVSSSTPHPAPCNQSSLPATSSWHPLHTGVLPASAHASRGIFSSSWGTQRPGGIVAAASSDASPKGDSHGESRGSNKGSQNSMVGCVCTVAAPPLKSLSKLTVSARASLALWHSLEKASMPACLHAGSQLANTAHHWTRCGHPLLSGRWAGTFPLKVVALCQCMSLNDSVCHTMSRFEGIQTCVDERARAGKAGCDPWQARNTFLAHHLCQRF